LGINLLELGSLSSLFLSSTDAAIISHLVSISANFPLKIEEPAVSDKKMGDTIDS